MATRKPIVNVNGTNQQIPNADTLSVGVGIDAAAAGALAIGATTATSVEVTPNLLVATTANPDSARLHVSGSGITHSSIQFNARPGAGNTYEWVNRDGAGHTWYVNAAATQAMTLTSAGRLGIGTNTPGGGLAVRSGLAPVWADWGSNSTSTSYMTFLKGGTTTAVGLIGTDGGAILTGGSGDNFGIRAENDLYFMSAATLNMVLTSAGRLGIGTGLATPAEKLEVSGGDARVHGLTVGRGSGAVSTNTAVGASALGGVTIGTQNTAMGFFAGGLIFSNGNNSYFGCLAGQKIAGSSNTGIGSNALGSGIGGLCDSNTAVGSSALGTLQTGFENVAIGREAGFTLTSGGQNVAVGAFALSSATTNGSNVAIGFNSLLLDELGTNSVAIGFRALDAQNPVAATAMNNVAVGSNAGGAVTTGTSNTLVGANAGDLITQAADCVIIGENADVQFAGAASNNSIVIGKGAVGVGANGITLGNASTQSIRFGTSLTSLPNPGINFNLGASSGMQIGHTSATTSATFIGFIQAGAQDGSIAGNGAGGTNYNTTSDYRLKTEVAPLVGASERLALLKPCSFRMSDVIQDGFIAHEVQEVVPLAVFGVKDAVDDHGAPLYQGLDQSRLVPLLTAACQELVAKAAAAEARADAAEARLASSEARLAALEAAVSKLSEVR